MNETCENAAKFLSEIVDGMGFDLKVSSNWTDEGCLAGPHWRRFTSRTG
jgi:hypothetical protein